MGGVGVSAYLSLILRRRVGRLFEAGRLLTFSAFRMGAYSNKYGTCLNSSKLCLGLCVDLGRVVRKVDNPLHWIQTSIPWIT